MRVRISGSPSRSWLKLVQIPQRIEHPPPRVPRDAGRVGQVQHRVARAAELHARVRRRQKRRVPQPAIQRLVARFAAGDHHDEGGQIGVVGPQAVAEPRAQARPPRLLAAGLQHGDAGVVVDRLGVQRFEKAEPIDDLRRVRQEVADPRAAAAVLLEFEQRRRQRLGLLLRRHRRQPLSHADRLRQLLALPLGQHRLVVEQIHLRRRPALAEEDDVLRPRLVVRQARQPRQRFPG